MYIGFRLGNSVMILVVYIALIPSIKMRNHEKKTLGLETEWKKKKKTFPSQFSHMISISNMVRNHVCNYQRVCLKFLMDSGV